MPSSQTAERDTSSTTSTPSLGKSSWFLPSSLGNITATTTTITGSISNAVSSRVYETGLLNQFIGYPATPQTAYIIQATVNQATYSAMQANQFTIPIRVKAWDDDGTGTGLIDTPIIANNAWVNSAWFDSQTGLWECTLPAGSLQPATKPNLVEVKKHLLRQRFKRQLNGPFLINGKLPRSKPDFSTVSQSEIVALKLLRGLLSSDTFRKYLKSGRALVVGESGLCYDIVRGSHHVGVYSPSKGKVAHLCVYVDPKCPPTDDVVAKILMVQCDEEGIWRKANVTQYLDNGHSYSIAEAEKRAFFARAVA